MDFIPAKKANQIAWLINCAAILTATPAAYGLTAPEALAVQTAVDTAATAYTLGTDPTTRTPVTVQEMNDAMQAAVALCRGANVQAQALPATNPDLVSAGFPVRSTIRTPQSPVTASCDIELVKVIPNELTVRGLNPDTPTSKKKPAGTGAIQFAMAVGTVAAVDPASATEYRFSTKNPTRLAFDPSQRGKVLTLWARYQSKAGIGGIKVYGPFGVAIVINLP
jgi:hypothetical protein